MINSRMTAYLLLAVHLTSITTVNAAIAQSAEYDEYEKAEREVPRLYEKLLSARSLECTFPKGYAAEKLSTTLEWEFREDKYVVKMAFSEIDYREGTTRLVSNDLNGSVRIMATLKSVTFLGISPVGNMTFTTVFPWYEKGTHAFVATYSRHADVFGPEASQHYGTCE